MAPCDHIVNLPADPSDIKGISDTLEAAAAHHVDTMRDRVESEAGRDALALVRPDAEGPLVIGARARSEVEIHLLMVRIMRAVDLSLDRDYALGGSVEEEAARLRVRSARCAPFLSVGDACRVACCGQRHYYIVNSVRDGDEEDDEDDLV
jgi:hypothetical protein